MTVWIEVRQDRYSAVGTITTGARRIGMEPGSRIAVIIDDGDGRFDYRKGTYLVRAEESRDGAWWCENRFAEWRGLLGDGRPFVIREKAGDPATRPVVAGRKKGVWEMGGFRMTAEEFGFVLVRRLGEVR